jgi:hypothetical protein
MIHNNYDVWVNFMKHYQVDLTGTVEKVRLSGLPDCEWLA